MMKMTTMTKNRKNIHILRECERRHFENEDKPFWDSYNLLNQELLNVTLTNSEES